MIQGLSNTTLYAWQFAIRPRNKAVYFLCCNATVYEKISFQLVQSLWFSFLPLEQFKAKKKLSFSWLVVKKVNKFCSTEEHCLTLISCFLQCWCLLSMSVFQPHFKLCRLLTFMQCTLESLITLFTLQRSTSVLMPEIWLQEV